MVSGYHGGHEDIEHFYSRKFCWTSLFYSSLKLCSILNSKVQHSISVLSEVIYFCSFSTSCTVVEFTTTQIGKIQTGSKKPKTKVCLLAVAERPPAAVMAVWPTPPTSMQRQVQFLDKT